MYEKRIVNDDCLISSNPVYCASVINNRIIDGLGGGSRGHVELGYHLTLDDWLDCSRDPGQE